jgi:hypothetical protein
MSPPSGASAPSTAVGPRINWALPEMVVLLFIVLSVKLYEVQETGTKDSIIPQFKTDPNKKLGYKFCSLLNCSLYMDAASNADYHIE